MILNKSFLYKKKWKKSLKKLQEKIFINRWLHAHTKYTIATRGSQRFEKNMAGVIPKTFEMYFIIKFSTNICGHHVYKNIWTPIIEESLVCKEDKRVEAQELDKNAIETYKLMDGNETLVGHLPIELSKLISFFVEMGDNHVKLRYW